MNARYYDPLLGTFVSPDTMVPQPGLVSDYNRYAYVRGRVMNAYDPSGHIAVCFQGGPGVLGSIIGNDSNASDKDAQQVYTEVGMLGMCQNALKDAGYTAEQYGEILLLNSNRRAMQKAYEHIIAQEESDPDAPVIIMGYSSGGATALQLAEQLGKESYQTPLGTIPTGHVPIKIDLLLTVDPETDPNWLMGPTPSSKGDNVEYEVNIFAGKAQGEESGYQNGMNVVKGALNIELANADHMAAAWGMEYETGGSDMNPETQRFMTFAVRAALNKNSN